MNIEGDDRVSLEALPNEILCQICEYFDARDLYGTFFDLNLRFNRLLRSLPHLSLRFHSIYDDRIPDASLIFASQLYSLIIHAEQPISFVPFSGIRRLTIWYPTDEQLMQIDGRSFPHLEYLSISYTVAKSSICNLYEKIFSNNFPRLQSCFLYGRETPRNSSNWSESPRLQHVHVTSNYPSILMACPHLTSLNLSMPKFHRYPIAASPHLHLKRLRLILTSITWFDDDQHLEILFRAVPNIERFSLHKIFSLTNAIDHLLQYDWLSSLLARYLPFLQQFIFHLYILNLFEIDRSEFDRSLTDVRESFTRIYPDGKKYLLRIKDYTS